MRLALFGGTFDPPHLGHLRIAAAAADRLALNQVLFAPTGRQPLKSATPHASFADRLAMTRLACADDARFIPTGLDAPHPTGQPNYTVDLLSTLAQQHPNAQLYMLTGADSFLTLPHWRNPAQLLTLAEWIVVSRPGTLLAEDQVAATLAAAAVPQLRARIHLLTGIDEDVSATRLRRLLAEGKDTSALLPEAVARYIAQNHLYHIACDSE